jgi:hypothetical protein
MGLNLHTIRFLLEARARGVTFENVATIGRLGLFVDRETLKRTLAQYAIDVSDQETHSLLQDARGFCEPLLRLLGASEVCSIDVSAYQEASVVHDMNEPVPETLKQRFSVVIDGGSLEHVFNFPRAIASCMEMIRTGGHFIGISPANNQMGHGFYQFSPELYFRVFSATNGFVTERMVIFQDCWPDNQWYDVRDPAETKRRVTLVNRYPAFLLIQARKRESVCPFRSTPQQSDYVTIWNESSDGRVVGPSVAGDRIRHARKRPGLARFGTALHKLVPASLKRRYHELRTGGSPFDSDLYTKIEP